MKYPKRKPTKQVRCTSDNGRHFFNVEREGVCYCSICGQPKGYCESTEFDKRYGEYMLPIAQEALNRKRLNSL